MTTHRPEAVETWATGGLEFGGVMVDTYTTAGGEVLDRIALDHYGTRIGSTELLLSSNPGLAALPMILPPGIQIALPSLPATSSARPVTLYD